MSSCSQFSVTPIVAAVVRHERAGGAKIREAIRRAADRLGISPRMTQVLLYGEPALITESRYRALMAAWWRDMDRQAADLRARAEQLQARAEAERIAERQYTLELGGAKWSGQSKRNSGSASAARVSRSGG